eukprot:SAG31_NODE_12952_length_904_cov_3.627329_2_plen_37_part_01
MRIRVRAGWGGGGGGGGGVFGGFLFPIRALGDGGPRA